MKTSKKPVETPRIDPTNPPKYGPADDSDIECVDAMKAMLGPEGFAAFVRGRILQLSWALTAAEDKELQAQKIQRYSEMLVEAGR